MKGKRNILTNAVNVPEHFFNTIGDENAAMALSDSDTTLDFEEHDPYIEFVNTGKIEQFLSEAAVSDKANQATVNLANDVWNCLKINFGRKLFYPNMSINDDGEIMMWISQGTLYLEFEFSGSDFEVFILDEASDESNTKTFRTVNNRLVSFISSGM